MTAKSKSAQSSWEVGERNLADNTITLYGGDGRIVAYVTPQPFYDKAHSQDYYARLMAAAPDLLEAVKAMQQACNEWAAEFTERSRAMNIGIVNDAYIRAERAIAKAENKS